MNNFYPSQVWRHCPYCGSHDIEWHNGTHRMQCTNCKQGFYINASAAVVALIKNPQGQLLFTRRKHNPAQGMLDLPGGFVELGESAEEAVRREIKEELNITLDTIRFAGSFPNRYLYGGIVYFTLDIVFYCAVGCFAGIAAADDITDYIFISPEDIVLEEIGLESIRKIAVQLGKDSIQ